MARRVMVWLLSIGFLLPFVTGAVRAAPVVRTYRIDGMIHGVTAEIVARALAESAANKDALFLLELDTPGGLVDATEEIIRSMLDSRVPICVYVGPRGAHAASAGFFLLLTGDIAAMAPITRTGASSVITLGGENKEGDIALKKASQDLQALIRSTARAHGRPPELAELAVKDAKSWSAEEALDAKLIDLVAENRDDLLRRIDGRVLHRVGGVTETLHIAGARVVEHQLTWSEEARGVVLHPGVLALMLALAALGIYVEFTHPGLIVPGAVGALALLIFLYGSRMLPVRYFAAALVIVGVVTFILEIKIASHGLLAVAGAFAIGFGLYMLFPSDVPGLALPMMTLLPILVLMVAGLGIVTFIVRKALRRPPVTGREGLVGEIGLTVTALAPEGLVHVHGEVWSARASATLAKGRPVRVVGAEGLLLYVEDAGGARRDAVPTTTSGIPEGENE